MELSKIAKSWIEMWQLDIEDPAREKYNWVEDFEFDVLQKDPDLVIDLVLEILLQNSSIEIIKVLSAGPLEQVLADHGDLIIDRVESLAKLNPLFAKLLGGVWQNSMSEEIWLRVQNAWDRSGWDGNAL